MLTLWKSHLSDYRLQSLPGHSTAAQCTNAKNKNDDEKPIKLRFLVIIVMICYGSIE